MKRHNATKIARGKKAWEKSVKIGGKAYDKAMIDAAKYGAKGDGVISMADSKLLLKAARPSGTNKDSYDAMEKATMAYIRKNFKFTGAADKLLRSSIAKLGAKQGKATKAMKAMKRHGATKIARGKKAWEKAVKIGGKAYDKAMIDAAKYGAKGDGVISMADSKLLLKAARPSGTNKDSY